jgi:hypothetical protein
VTYDLRQRFAVAGRTVTDTIAAPALQRGITIDRAFLDGLNTVQADFISKGVILAAR